MQKTIRRRACAVRRTSPRTCSRSTNVPCAWRCRSLRKPRWPMKTANSNDIQTLFEGFVKAAVTAIEQRDPTTSGHSLRVAAYTQGLAEIVDQVVTGPYGGSHFDHEQMKEIRYAALLHDFGKVGVREEVLVKAKKLYPLQMELVKQRFDYIRKEVEVGMVRRK